jgi:hypothetical protein
VTNISNLHPIWAADLKALKARERERDDLDLDPPEKAKYIAFSELSEWLDTNMSLNEVLYPSFSILSPVFTPGIGASPKFSQSNSPLASCDDQSNGSNSPLGHDTIVFPPCEIRPTRIISTMSSLSKSKPTVINNCATTIMHVSVEDERTAARGHHRPEDHFMCVSGEEGRMSKSRKSTTSLSSAMSVSDQDQDPGGENTDSFAESDGAMSEGVSMEVPHAEGSGTGGQSKGKRPDLPGGRGARSDPDTEEDGDSDSGAEECASRHEEGAENLDALKGYSARRRRRRREGGASLPHLSINTSQGGHMHFLSAYSCVSISNCSDCEIVIGAVSGAVVVHGCERIKLTVACRKLIVQNSLECDLHVATLSASVIAGDSRSLIFGKCCYVMLCCAGGFCLLSVSALSNISSSFSSLPSPTLVPHILVSAHALPPSPFCVSSPSLRDTCSRPYSHPESLELHHCISTSLYSLPLYFIVLRVQCFAGAHSDGALMTPSLPLSLFPSPSRPLQHCLQAPPITPPLGGALGTMRRGQQDRRQPSLWGENQLLVQPVRCEHVSGSGAEQQQSIRVT